MGKRVRGEKDSKIGTNIKNWSGWGDFFTLKALGGKRKNLGGRTKLQIRSDQDGVNEKKEDISRTKREV